MKFKILILISLLLLFMNTASAANYHVTAGATGGGDGSLGNPWTIVEGFANAVAGDGIAIHNDGVYTDVHPVIGHSGSSGNFIVFDMYDEGGGDPIILDGVDDTGRGIDLNGQSFIIINNIEIYNYEYGMYDEYGGNEITIMFNDIHDCDYGMMLDSLGPGSSTIATNDVHHNRMGGIAFFSCSGNYMVGANYAYNNGGHGIELHSCNGGLFTSNEIYLNSGSGMYMSNCGSTNSVEISWNTIYSNTEHGILSYSTGCGNTFEGNTITDASGGYYDYAEESSGFGWITSSLDRSDIYGATHNYDIWFGFKEGGLEYHYDIRHASTSFSDVAPLSDQYTRTIVHSGILRDHVIYSTGLPLGAYSLVSTTSGVLETVTNVGGGAAFTVPMGVGTYYVEEYTDITPPTYSEVSYNNTNGGQPTLFTIKCDDDMALHPSGQYIFATNNSGSWVNDSAVSFTSTPQYVNVIKTLNPTHGAVIGFMLYTTDNVGNPGSSPIYTLTVKENEMNFLFENKSVSDTIILQGDTSIISVNINDPDGTIIDASVKIGDVNYSMTNIFDNIWSYEFPGTVTGTYYITDFYAEDDDGGQNSTVSNLNITVTSSSAVAFYSTTYNEPPLIVEDKEKTTTNKVSEGFEEVIVFIRENILLILFIIGVLGLASYLLLESSKK